MMGLRSTGMLASMATCVLVIGCAPPKRTADVWDSYDIRPPLQPTAQNYSAPRPVGVIDNDVYYVAPDCSIMDSPACGGD